MMYLFYKHEGMYNDHCTPSLVNGYFYRLWKPKVIHVVPPGLRLFPYAIWSLMHFLRIFSNQDYGVFIISRNDGYIAHHSIIIPSYFRFPFMGYEDLQVGYVWTSEEDRGKGLASFALRKIIETYSKSGRKIWYVTDSDNVQSAKIAEKTGFALYGEGIRSRRMGMSVFGAYEIKKYVTSLKS